MVTVFFVLELTLLAVPVLCLICVMVARVKDRKRARAVNNAKVSSTTIQQGPNGRTIFEIKSTRPLPATGVAVASRSPKSPLVPFPSQQASNPQRSRKLSLKNTWQRLSRPFSVVPQPKYPQDDETELTPKPPAMAFDKGTFEECIPTKYKEKVKPASAQDSEATYSSSNCNGQHAEAAGTTGSSDHYPDSAVSPASMTNMPLSSSIADRISNNHSSRNPAETFQISPLTSRAVIQAPRSDLPTPRGKPQTEPFVNAGFVLRSPCVPKYNLGTSRGFVPAAGRDVRKHPQVGVQETRQSVSVGIEFLGDGTMEEISDANRQFEGRSDLARPLKAATGNGITRIKPESV